MKNRSISKRTSFAFVLFCGLAIAYGNNFLSAQETLSTEGVVGDVDQGRRAPVLTFSTEVAADGSSAKILADTQIINEEFKKYPISVEFYVNGKLYSKQFRSLELPAPLGIDIPKELAPMPFNYSIVATLLHPNRQYVTVAQGAIPSGPSSGTMNCTATETVGGDAVGVTLTQPAAATIGSDNSLSFTLTQDDQSAVVSLTVTPSTSSTSLEASGTVVVQQGTSASVSYDISGTVEASGSTVSAIEATSADGSSLTLSCASTSPVTAAATLADTAGSTDESSDLESSGIADVLNAAPGAGSSDEGYGPGPNGESNFIPIDKVDGVTVVN